MSFAFLLVSNLLIIFLLIGCGHSAFLDNSTDELPPANQSQNQISSPLPVKNNPWQQAREDLANAINANPLPPITPIAQTQTLQESEPANPLDAYIQQIVRFVPGVGAGFGQDGLIKWLLGPPYGGGQFTGSLDVVSLGNGGEIVLGFKNYIPIDGTGPDFIIFENAFQVIGTNTMFVEPAIVGVSQDGTNFIDFPCDLTPPYKGCAGTHVVFANPGLNDINARDPNTAGGDAYDLSQVGLKYIQFIRIRDANSNLGGDVAIRAGQAGFDLDAISIIHGAKP